jgi:Tfp pilus assembly protein PilP
MLAAAASGLHAQAKPASGTGAAPATTAAAKPAQQPVKPADKPPVAKPASSPATAQNKPAPAPVNKQASPAAKPAAPASSAKPSGAKPSTATAKPGVPKAKAKPSPKPAAKRSTPKKTKAATSAANGAPAAETRVAKRDPFESMIGREHSGSTQTGPLPAGKAGLQVSSLRLDGIVRAPNGMIAVVSNPQSRTYFLREGDQLYDGRVEKIAMDGVSFHEVGKDAFGKPVERQVNKRIYASAGEQQ